jgi:hypothetical protein
MLQGGEQPNTKLFISYSSKDMAFGGRLEEALKTRGIELVIDRSEIYGSGPVEAYRGANCAGGHICIRTQPAARPMYADRVR